jgi:hypothetical protein
VKIMIPFSALIIGAQHLCESIRRGFPSEALAALAVVCIALLLMLLPEPSCMQCGAPRRSPDSLFCETHGGPL